jgi:predicted SAM-dependent methyltransferase
MICDLVSPKPITFRHGSYKELKNMKLHIGGLQVKEGWKILNIMNDEGVDFIGDISDLSQFSNNSIDEIYASHVFEHLSHKKIDGTLDGIHRVLRPGGTFQISVPDMDRLFSLYLNPNTSKQMRFFLMCVIFGGQNDPFDFHYFGWSEDTLSDAFTRHQFREVKRVENFGYFNDTSSMLIGELPISLNMVATK